MEGAAVAVCEILKYLIIHWTCEARVSKGTLLEGQLMISIETLNSKPQANALRCVTTIASAGCLYSGFILKKFIKEIQSVLPRFSAKELTWTSEESSCSQHASGLTPFQIIFEVDEEPRTLIRDCLIIKHFIRKVIVVHPKIRFNFSVEVNGVLSTDVFGVENEPTLNLSNGIALVVNCRRYVRSNFGTTEAHCDRIHPVLGHPVTLVIPDDMAGMDLLGELTLTPAAALCPSQKVFSNQLSRISSASIFLYGPLGLPLMSSSWKEPTTAIFKDTSYFIDWKKYHLCMVPNLDLDLDKDVMLPDVGYQAGSSQRDQSQNMDPPGQTLLLFLFVDFHSGFPVQQTELWGVHTLLTTHLSTVLRESHSVVRASIQFTVDQVLGQHHQAVKTQQKLKASLSVAVNSILTIVTGSTDSSFRKTCLQALQAADTQEFGTKLHKVFHEIAQHRFLHQGPCDRKQHPSPEEKDSAPRTEAARENICPERFAENKRLKTGVDETRAPSPAAAATRRPEPRAAPAPGAPSPGRGLEEALWLREVSNLSEWLRP